MLSVRVSQSQEAQYIKIQITRYKLTRYNRRIAKYILYNILVKKFKTHGQGIGREQ